MASSVSFGLYFAIAGAVFLDDYKVPQYTFHDWQLLAGVPLGLFAALLVTLLAGFMMAGRCCDTSQPMLSTAEAATEMHISINTIKSYVRHIYRKLAATRRGEAVRRARQLQLI